MDTFSKLVRMVVLLAAAALTGCATQKLSPAPSEGLDADAAVVFAVDDLIRQADDGRGFLPAAARANFVRPGQAQTVHVGSVDLA